MLIKKNQRMTADKFRAVLAELSASPALDYSPANKAGWNCWMGNSQFRGLLLDGDGAGVRYSDKKGWTLDCRGTYDMLTLDELKKLFKLLYWDKIPVSPSASMLTGSWNGKPMSWCGDAGFDLSVV